MQEENIVPEAETEALDNSIDTQEESAETSQTEDTESHEEEQESINFERLQKKSQALESQGAQYKKQLDGYSQWLLAKEERTKEYLIDQGLNESQVAEALDRIKQSKPGIWEAKKPTEPVDNKSSTQPLDISKLKSEVKAELELDNYVKTSQQEFIAEVPEMNPQNYINATPEERQLISEFANNVDYLARSLMRINAMSYKDALKSSYKTLVASLGGEEEAKEAGYIEGLAQQNADAATSFGNMGGQSSSHTSSPLTPQERDMAAKLKMSEEDYAKYKR